MAFGKVTIFIDGSAFISCVLRCRLTRKSDGLTRGRSRSFCNMLQRYVEETVSGDVTMWR
jgi:hypothetical protein